MKDSHLDAPIPFALSRLDTPIPYRPRARSTRDTGSLEELIVPSGAPPAPPSAPALQEAV